MPTVIDSLVISLGLDSSKFVSGQKDAEAAMAKTKDAALKQSKELETSNKKFAESFNIVKREAAALFAVIAGAESIKQFIADVTTATAALGRLSANINVNPQELDAWGLAIERAGGDAAEAATDFQTLSQQLFDLKQNGKNIPESLQKMGAEARVPIDYNHGLPGYLHSIAGAAARLTALHGGDRSDAFNFLKQAGIGPGMAQVLIDNGAALDDFIGKLKKLAPTDKQIADSERLQKSWFELTQQATALGRAMVDNIEAPLEFILSKAKAATDALQKLMDVNAPKRDAENAGGAKAVGTNFAARSLLQTAPLLKFFGLLDGGGGDPIGTGSGILKWFVDNWGIKSAGAADFGPGFGQGSHPHPASGLFIQGQQVSRGNPMPVTIVAGTETGGGGGFLSWLFGGGSPTSQGAGSTSSQGGGSSGGGIVASAAKGLAHLLGGGGGTGAAPALSSTVTDKSIPPEGRAFLDLIASTESRGEYNILNGGGHFSGYADHPGGPAAGRYQFLASTWRGVKSALGLPDFGPKSQDQAGWYLAQNDYKKQTGRDLLADLKSGKVNEAVGALGGTWLGLRSLGGTASQGGYNRFLGAENGGGSGGGMSPAGGPWVKSGDREYATDANGNIVSGTSRSLSSSGIFSAPHRPVSHTPLSTMSALHPVTTSSTSNSMHIDQIHVNAPNATNAHGIADRISDALRQSAMTTTANFGQA
jgi:hypothetical protein